jgi:membrane protease YdiL (CAAX protease family)
MEFENIFRNRFGNFRAGWRILIWLGMVITCFLPVAGLLKIWDLLSPDRSGSGGLEEFTSLVMIVFYVGLDLSIILGSWLTLRWIDKRPYALLGLDFSFKAIRDFSKGFLLGFINFLMIFGVMKISGLIDVKLSNLNSAVLKGMILYFIAFALAAFFEEAINRGYIFQALLEGTGMWIAVISISVVFVLGHATNTGFDWNNAVFFFVHGIIYCTLYLLTRSIWVPVGFHLAWNWIQGPLFGMNVSGQEIKNTFFLVEAKGPVILSGGAFGPEGSLISIVISVLFIVILVKSGWLKPDVFRIKLWQKYAAGSGPEPSD